MKALKSQPMGEINQGAKDLGWKAVSQ